MKKVLITGALGFVGRNLTAQLRMNKELELFLADIDTAKEDLMSYSEEADFIIHLAGVNRPKDEEEFITGNVRYTEQILERLSLRKDAPSVLITSSIQSDIDNAYGRSKREAENAVFRYSKENDVKVYVFKLPNLFGKWSRPNYNSVVSTFCYNISHDIPIRIDDETRVLSLVYIDDLLAAISDALEGRLNPHNDGYCYVETIHEISLKDLAETITSFHKNRKTLLMPKLEGLSKKIYSTYLSYLDEDDFSYELIEHSDVRGSFYEFLKTDNHGQMSVSTTAPGITRGNHWHHTKVEKFLVISGKAAIRLRRIDDDNIIEYIVDSTRPEVVDIPVGYTHSITNISTSEILITLIWANELFDSENPDTYYEEV